MHIFSIKTTIRKRILSARGDKGMTDSRFESCIALIRQGSTEGLREIYEAYYKLIYSVMYSVVGNRMTAEDLTADLFVKLWEKLADAYRHGSGHRAWLAACARNMATDHIRKSSRELLTIDAPEDDNTPRTEPVSDGDFTDDIIGKISVNEAMKRLDESERTIVDLKLFADLTFKEISKALAMPLGTVTWKYRRAIGKLSNYVKEVQDI